jgi:hypothetical protein
MITVCLILGLLAGGIAHLKHEKPEQRQHLFEDEDGNKANPFSELKDGTNAEQTESYKYPTEHFD